MLPGQTHQRYLLKWTFFLLQSISNSTKTTYYLQRYQETYDTGDMARYDITPFVTNSILVFKPGSCYNGFPSVIRSNDRTWRLLPTRTDT